MPLAFFQDQRVYGAACVPQPLSPCHTGGRNLGAAGLEMEKNAGAGRGGWGLSPPATTIAKAPDS